MSQSPRFRAALTALVIATSVSVVTAQRGQQAPAPGAPPTPRATAPLDLEGYWVSVVTEDWRWRMMTPAKGDAPGVPLSLEGRKVTNAWDLARDNAGGQATQCKAYGAGGIMRIPTRLNIAWQDDNTLKIDTDAGRQTRLIRFPGATSLPARGEPTLQGFSVASWQTRTTGAPILDEEAPAAAGRGRGVGPGPQKGSLKVITTNLRPGYLRKNGIPYSENTTVTEYFDRHSDFGAEWFTVMTVVDDPRYLRAPFVTTTHFKKEPDGSKWNPQACETLPPVAPLSRGEDVG